MFCGFCTFFDPLFIIDINILQWTYHISAKTILFWKWKLWKFSYSFPIIEIFYFINWIVATETTEGGKQFKGENYSRKYGIRKIEHQIESFAQYLPEAVPLQNSSKIPIGETRKLTRRESAIFALYFIIRSEFCQKNRRQRNSLIISVGVLSLIISVGVLSRIPPTKAAGLTFCLSTLAGLKMISE